MEMNSGTNYSEERIRNCFEKRLLSERRKKNRIRLCISLIIIGILVYILFDMIAGIAVVQSDSMKPNLVAGDIVLFYRLKHNYNRNDIVIFPEEKGNELLIKRIIAVTGDTVDIDNKTGTLLINQIAQKEEEIIGNTYAREGGIAFPVKVPKYDVFVLGDNRDVALDSRDFGTISKKKIIGKVIFVIRKL